MTLRYLLAHLRFSFILMLLVSGSLSGWTQCTTVINTFPYSQDFEASDGNWVSGGAASDWVWGTPTKRVINRASSGIRCWITGGLQNTRYNDNENSWLMSPCFDFTSVANPYLRIALFWETEKKYDGATLEYSTDGGNSWRLLGSSADNVTCPGNNWFNTTSITTLSGDGWSGNVQPTAPCPGGGGGGSGHWVFSGHDMSSLSGRSNVRLRFRFAAGSRCNDYDGFAVDDIWIGELQGASAAFSFSCNPSSRTVDFVPVSATCGNTYSWNFGDPSTGAANVSSLASPSHTFSGPGDYPVQLVVTAGNGSTATLTQNIRVTQLAAELLVPVTCNGGHDAQMTVHVSPAGTYNYSWSAVPQQTGVIATGLGVGNYTVDVTAPGTCPNRTTVTITEPAPITHSQVTRDARCNGANGFAEISPLGGTAPYNFNWQPAAGTSGSNNQLLPGNYTVAITDDRGCTDTARFGIGNNNNFSVSLGRDTVLCTGEMLLLYPGSFNTYQWQDGSTDSAFLVTETGDYSVQVTDASGCSGTAHIKVTVDCSDIWFPDAFSPNNDGRNDAFGPLGNRSALSNYHLSVYGRWGQLVFESSNPFEKWSARNVSGGNGSQIFVWVAQYNLTRHQETVTRKGTVLLLR
jgi:gliding motility-associated-like protein